jgi:hypothetical protein
MSEEKKNKPDEGYDIFIANQTFPEADKIFTSHLKTSG